nr:retrotransposon protein, putative, Ty1-copia subclass [Tanacetum cinerariifolium]
MLEEDQTNNVDQTDQDDGDDEDAGDQEIDQPPDLTDYQLVLDREPMTRMKPLRFRDESNMAAYALAVAEKEDTREPLTYQEATICKAEIWSTKSLLKREFDIKDLGEPKKILGMEIVRDRSHKILRVSQSGYIYKILNNFRIDNGKSVQMPLGGYFKLSLKDCPIRDCDVERMSKVPYANVVGSLMYLIWCAIYISDSSSPASGNNHNALV